MSSPEQFKCSDCGHTGPLDVHGACGQCQSQKVMSLELLQALYGWAVSGMAEQAVAKRTMPA